MRRAVRLSYIAVMATSAYVHAQHSSPPAGLSEKEKAKLQKKRASEKEIDEAYKFTLSQIPKPNNKKSILGTVCARFLKNSLRNVRFWAQSGHLPPNPLKVSNVP